jgi:opacity protein-like surface antigen
VSVLIRRLLLAAVATVLTTSVAAAQAGRKEQGDRPLIGPHAEFATNDLDFGIGAQFSYPVANRFDIYPTFDYYFAGKNLTVFSIDGAVRYWPKLNMKNAGLYAGAGLNWSHVSVDLPAPFKDASNSEIGLSLVGGWMFKQVSWLPFGQIRVVIGDADRVEFGGGVNFKL